MRLILPSTRRRQHRASPSAWIRGSHGYISPMPRAIGRARNRGRENRALWLARRRQKPASGWRNFQDPQNSLLYTFIGLPEPRVRERAYRPEHPAAVYPVTYGESSGWC